MPVTAALRRNEEYYAEFGRFIRMRLRERPPEYAVEFVL
jgi:hypothetical protein